MNRPPARRPAAGGFTLIELLAVAAVIALLVGLVIGIARYAENRARGSRARAELATIETALEQFRLDRGYYPTSTTVRVSCRYWAEAQNSGLLHEALAGAGAAYLQFGPTQVRNPYTVESRFWNFTHNFAVIVDPWGSPYNYYRTNPIQTDMVNSNFSPSPYDNGHLTGGQRNLVTYDLWSYGPNRLTYAGPNAGWMDWVPRGEWNLNAARDDIGNFTP